MLQIGHLAALPEWLKASVSTIIGAIVGFIFGMLADAFKTRLTDRRKLRAMQRAIYSEIAYLYESASVYRWTNRHVSSESEWWKGTNVRRIKQWRMDAYKFCKNNPDVFYLIPHHHAIELIYDGLNIVHASSDLDYEAIQTLGTNLVGSIRLCARGQLMSMDFKTLKRIAPKGYEQIMEDVQLEDRLKYLQAHPSPENDAEFKKLLDNQIRVTLSDLRY